MSSPQLYMDDIDTDDIYEICDCGLVITQDMLKYECECNDLSDFVTDTEELSSYSESEDEFSSSCSQSYHQEYDESENQL